MFSQIKKIRKSVRFWWLFVSFWTFIVFIVIAFNFFSGSAYQGMLNPVLAVYVAILAIYAGDKEFQRWQDRHRGRHPGEIFVIVWTVLIIFLMICEFSFRGVCHLSGEVFSTYIAVLTILAVTRHSRRLYEGKKRKE
jgi:phosphatidylserine synthase